MVGISRGKRCDMCKERRRKCDGRLPTCSLCTRLKCACVRPGKRYLFVGSRHDLPVGHANSAEPEASGSSTEDDQTGQEPVSRPRARSYYSGAVPRSLTASPPHDLAQKLAWVLSESNNYGYNMATTWGDYLLEIPKHIGECSALDAAVKVVLSGYSSFRTGRHCTNVTVAREYSSALLQLREDVNNFTGRSLPLIIAAIMLLALYENIDGSIKTGWVAHAGGASRLVRSSEFDPWESTLSRQVLASIRGTLVVEALLTEQSFEPTSQLWQDALDVPEYDHALHKEAYRYLALLPVLRKSLKTMLVERRDTGREPLGWTRVFDDIRKHAVAHQPVLDGLLEEFDTRLRASNSCPDPIAAFHQDLDNLTALRHAFPAMVTHILLHTWLSIRDAAAFSTVRTLSQRICSYIPLAMSFRPLGSTHLVIPLHCAYIGMSAPAQKIWLRDQINLIHTDLQGPRAAYVPLATMDWWADTLSLRFLSPVTAPWGNATQSVNSILPREMSEWARERVLKRTPRYTIGRSDPEAETRDYDEVAESLGRASLEDEVANLRSSMYK